MKRTVTLIVSVVMASCSSVNKTGDKATDAILEHMAQEERIIGKDWDERFTRDGLINGEYVAIGATTTKNLDTAILPLKINAESIAIGNLLKSAPSDFKKIVQRTINSLDGNEGSTTENQIMVTEAKALTGLKSQFKDFQCVKKAIPNTNLEYTFIRECRVLVRIPASKLVEAYDFTLSTKYGLDKKSEVQKVLEKNLADFYRPVAQRGTASSK